MEFKDEDCQQKWINTGKNVDITVADIHPTIENNNNTVYLREYMTKYNKQLFWNTKQELKVTGKFKYVWFKRGFIRARKDDNEKVYIIKNIDDLQNVISKVSKT